VLELPEVEVLRKDLEKEVVGKRVKDVDVQTGIVRPFHRNRPELRQGPRGPQGRGRRRRGSVIFLDLDEGRPGSSTRVRTARCTARPPRGAGRATPT
jgi:formamidopyrimidine-DNA glycosylase